MVADFGWAFGATFLGLTAAAFALRTQLGVGKYPIWALFAVGIAFACGGVERVKPEALFAIGRVREGWEPGLVA